MHEESVARAILNLAREKITESSRGSEQACTGELTVSGLTVACGELSGVDPTLLSLALERLCASSIAFVHCECSVQQTPLEAHCSDCQRDFALQDFVFRCPCGSQKLTITRGETVVLESLTFTDRQ
ncbi:MAG: hydrogenase maturation nickel metallochaperone HypA [Planctomycetaceae bacterium]